MKQDEARQDKKRINDKIKRQSTKTRQGMVTRNETKWDNEIRREKKTREKETKEKRQDQVQHDETK